VMSRALLFVGRLLQCVKKEGRPLSRSALALQRSMPEVNHEHPSGTRPARYSRAVGCQEGRPLPYVRCQCTVHPRLDGTICLLTPQAGKGTSGIQ
jgi:hypothetical protein